MNTLMKKTIHTNCFCFAALCIFILILTSCEGADPGSDTMTYSDPHAETGTLAFSLILHRDDGTRQALDKLSDHCIESGGEIDTVTAALYNETKKRTIKTGGPWDCDKGKGTLTDVPVGHAMILVIQGSAENGALLYRGEKKNISVAKGQSKQTVVVDVWPVENLAPVMENLKNRTVNPGDPVTFEVKASDLNMDDLTYSVESDTLYNVEDYFESEEAPHMFSWTPGITDVGITYTLTFTVSDGKLRDQKEMTITVLDPNPNSPPYFIDPVNGDDFGFTEGEPVEIHVQVGDDDFDPITIAHSGIEGKLGSGTVANNSYFEWQTGLGDAGDYTIQFTASDGTEDASVTVAIKVNPIGNLAPVMEDLRSRTVNPGDPVTFEVKASDKNMDDLTYSVEGNLSNVENYFESENSPHMFSWMPGINDAGMTYTLTFTVTDGELSDQKEMTITVTNPFPNSAPYFNAPGDGDNFEFIEGDPVTIDIQVNDDDFDPVSITHSGIEGKLESGSVANNSQFTWQTNVGDAGDYTIQFTATDGTDSTSVTVNLTIAEQVISP